MECFKGSPKTIRVLKNPIENNSKQSLRRLAANEEYTLESFEKCFESSIKYSVAKMIETTQQAAREKEQAITDFYIHTGRTFSKESPDFYNIISKKVFEIPAVDNRRLELC